VCHPLFDAAEKMASMRSHNGEKWEESGMRKKQRKRRTGRKGDSIVTGSR